MHAKVDAFSESLKLIQKIFIKSFTMKVCMKNINIFLPVSRLNTSTFELNMKRVFAKA